MDGSWSAGPKGEMARTAAGGATMFFQPVQSPQWVRHPCGLICRKVG